MREEAVRRSTWAGLYALSLLVATCASVESPDNPTGDGCDPAWTYDARLTDDLRRMNVVVRFRDGLPPRLTLGEPRAAGSLERVRIVDGDGTIRRSGSEWILSGVDPGEAVAYSVDLGVGDRSGGPRLATVPGRYLLRPVGAERRRCAELRLRVPQGVEVSTPWKERTRRSEAAVRVFELPPSTFEWTAHTLFGDLGLRRVEAASAVAQVVVLPGDLRSTPEGRDRWIAAAMDAVGDLYDGFPVPDVQVLVRPIGASRSPVPFGETLRGGGPAVSLLLSGEATDDELPGEWVAIHEFVHLGHPWVRREDAWLSEGLATYYQEVLRARAGFIAPESAWAALHRGFDRGRASHRGAPLRKESRRMTRVHSFMNVYWSGAAIALEWDVALRRSTHGRLSLDHALRELRRTFAGDGRVYPAADLVRHLDQWLGRPLFSRIANAHLRSRRFPDLENAYAALGLDPAGGAVVGPSKLRDGIVRRTSR